MGAQGRTVQKGVELVGQVEVVEGDGMCAVAQRRRRVPVPETGLCIQHLPLINQMRGNTGPKAVQGGPFDTGGGADRAELVGQRIGGHVHGPLRRGREHPSPIGILVGMPTTGLGPRAHIRR